MKSYIFSILVFAFLSQRLLARTTANLSYECELPSPSGKYFAKVELNLETLLMEVALDDGTQVKGYASSTLDKSTGATVYLLQGATEPNAQQLLLTVKNQGQWAEFQRTYSGHSFTCK